MPDINITVAHKVAVSDTQSIVCDNSDYAVHWTLDEEWNAYDTKTMRTIYMDGTYEDTVFAGDTIALPVCTVPGAVQIVLFAGDIRTSRVAILRALPSVRSAAGAPKDPDKSVYDQLMERMAQLETPDWAQNDPDAKDYVRNRTHYVSRERKALVPEQEVTTAVQDNFNTAMLNDVDSDALKTLYDSEDDTTFDVVFDGTSYPCKWLEQGGNRIPVFGNLAIVNSNFTDTGEPFCVELLIQSDAIAALAIACKVAGTHTVAVSYQQDVVHKIDGKFLPDDIGAVQPDWDEQSEDAKGFIKNKPEPTVIWTGKLFCGVDPKTLTIQEAYDLALSKMPYLFAELNYESNFTGSMYTRKSSQIVSIVRYPVETKLGIGFAYVNMGEGTTGTANGVLAFTKIPGEKFKS